FDPDADDEAQIKTAVQQIDTAVAELLLVRNALQPNPKFTEGLEEWVEILTQYDDFFSTDYSGYWLRKIKRADGRTLAWEDDEQHGHGEEPNMQEALEAFEADQDVPEGYFVIDRDLAVKAWFIGVSKYGESWYENGDSTTYDVVLQLALLGEIRYG
ncbi:MAG: hypothetical protein HY675_25600, partial [Chloroflexi bacterium]|nr:hypothetical protein [Chloroflexota bacterium]